VPGTVNTFPNHNYEQDLGDGASRENNTHEDIQCPVCGYYCLGHGGHGCIDKPSMVNNA